MYVCVCVGGGGGGLCICMCVRVCGVCAYVCVLGEGVYMCGVCFRIEILNIS